MERLCETSRSIASRIMVRLQLLEENTQLDVCVCAYLCVCMCDSLVWQIRPLNFVCFNMLICANQCGISLRQSNSLSQPSRNLLSIEYAKFTEYFTDNQIGIRLETILNIVVTTILVVWHWLIATYHIITTIIIRPWQINSMFGRLRTWQIKLKKIMWSLKKSVLTCRLFNIVQVAINIEAKGS